MSFLVSFLPQVPLPVARWTDPVQRRPPHRVAQAFERARIDTLADLTRRVPRRRRWWVVIPGLGVGSARLIEDFFAQRPKLTGPARRSSPRRPCRPRVGSN